jgi:acetyltransferase-like isoleucine patch superfamily enzyme
MIKTVWFELLSRVSPISFVKAYGVPFGYGCRFIAVRRQTFGSEPYLIKLGNKVSMSEGVRFITHDGGVWVLRNIYKECKHVDLFGRIEIGDNVFLGMNVTILPGVTIGNNCIVGTGAIVTKDLPPNSVAAGVPARVLTQTQEYLNKNKHKFIDTKHLIQSEKEQVVPSFLDSLNEQR